MALSGRCSLQDFKVEPQCVCHQAMGGFNQTQSKEIWYIEMILQDSKGDRLHAILPRSLIKRWGQVLKEFHMFNMRWFVVIESRAVSRTTEFDLYLTISNRTRVTPVVNSSFPLEALRVKPINELLEAERIDDTELFDIVALVVGTWEGGPNGNADKN
ncbi:hypothetical protein PIB30_021892 [Stylosanthes scabra]|uniref:Replication protein A 70 kDa DNA-binding subunit B/D first OB fold domain-containing protein n=1 Tax=Stylosanthes scabra TaxID=79078 RepID=A0ABU6S960_9FABA|nr:hypothetical protein [Stylosanthes scabra]